MYISQVPLAVFPSTVMSGWIAMCPSNRVVPRFFARTPKYISVQIHFSLLYIYFQFASIWKWSAFTLLSFAKMARAANGNDRPTP